MNFCAKGVFRPFVSVDRSEQAIGSQIVSHLKVPIAVVELVQHGDSLGAGFRHLPFLFLDFSRVPFLERLNDKENPPRASMMDAITRWLSSNGATLENMKRSSGPSGIRQGNQFNSLSSPFDKLADAIKDIDQETNNNEDHADAQH